MNLCQQPDDDFFSLESLTPNAFQTSEKRRAQNLIKARSCRTRSRIVARYAKSKQILEGLLPRSIPPGESWHVLSSGDVDAMAYLLHFAAGEKITHLLFSTWCMALKEVQQIAVLIDANPSARVEAYVGEIFASQYPEAYQHLRDVLRPTTGRLCVFRNHSKIILVATEQQKIVIESSANLNTNPRTENTPVTHDARLYAHHKGYFDAIKSFERDFDHWRPLADTIL